MRRNSLMVSFFLSLESLKTNDYYQTPLSEMYYYTTKCSHLDDEELKEHFCSAFIPFIHKLPKITDTLKLKGNLRISWAFDINYNKNIDLIFFPEENPYLNYAVLYAKDFPKTFEKEEDSLLFIDRELSDLKIPYHINYDFVQEILSQSNLSQSQQERFFQVRFGSVFIPMEIEFEWYIVYWYYQGIDWGLTNIEKTILFPKNDKYLNFRRLDFSFLCLGIIKSYSVLPINTPLNYDYEEVLAHNYNNERLITYKDLFTPLPTAALATTMTNINDFIVNLRDKPNTKEGKIIAQLFSQEFSYALLEPKFQKLQEENGWGDETPFSFLYEELSTYYLAHKSYYEKEKQNLINPLWRDEYLILVWNIESNNWAKVWVLKMPDKKV